MTSGAEDEVHWGDEMKILPSWVRSLVVAVRLGGLILVVVVLIGVMLARDLGIFQDQATIDRRAAVDLALKQIEQLHRSEQLLLDTKNALDSHVSVVEKHSASTEAIARTLCLIIPNLTPGERHMCMTGDREMVQQHYRRGER